MTWLSGCIERLQRRRQVQDQLRVLDHVETHDGGCAESVEQLTQWTAMPRQLDVSRQQALGEHRS
ncbi:hypothetical protein WJ55_10270 [Burkholderia ubonensis]|nr:hypothetical protein WJ34_12195 [Burkholderia ubonensis]KVH19860.1 hypothetical protein WJ37_19460 [Burkholderia ubonensis]KVH50229.1 hypothetical protein WJ38_12875 [Burkholderia ubonensis]KVH87127.1 hypothetical protein WJ43_01600 [Burkholderia ubonensis]KVM37692.1 hypothetical protein WJ55_10270 [Burkholderia ubonensis]